MTSDELRTLIKAILLRELKKLLKDSLKTEVSTSSATPGYMVPSAFQGNSEKNKRKRRQTAGKSGMKVIGTIEPADKL